MKKVKKKNSSWRQFWKNHEFVDLVLKTKKVKNKRSKRKKDESLFYFPNKYCKKLNTPAFFL